MVSLNGNGPAFICALVLWALGVYVFYWVIRLAVRHAIADAEARSAGRARQDDDRPMGPTE